MASVTIKGERDGLVLLLNDDAGDDDAALSTQVRAYLESNASFFAGADVTLDAGDRRLSETALVELLEILREFELEPVALRSDDETTRSAARALDLALPLNVTEPVALTESMPEESRPAFVVRRTLRSGQSIRHPDSIIVYGDVNPGAEVVAGGDVIVWGALRGVVHAGASGDDSAIVCALVLSPTQLRIGQHIARPPDEQTTADVLRQMLAKFAPGAGATPEVARVQDGNIVVSAARETAAQTDG